ncbi:hypothetical protein [Methylobacterium sp. 77]|uniref:hypothetical protein n=1 Tax=Methylobacterium sp. 77 TaxID=1101192 RepID=UPI000377F21A|nr:hypothetical protein [Methylobacterium sp. 77]
MTKHPALAATSLADAVTEAYVDQAKPPLTQELIERVRSALINAIDPHGGTGSGGDPQDCINAALDAFELELQSIVGPRIASLDKATGAVTMKHRSEGGQPLRAFGGQ